MEESIRWRNMRTAPRDGSRILVTIRASEQGPVAVRPVDEIVQYAEPELKCWMPLPGVNTDAMARPPAWEGEDEEELDGSGI